MDNETNRKIIFCSSSGCIPFTRYNSPREYIYTGLSSGLLIYPLKIVRARLTSTARFAFRVYREAQSRLTSHQRQEGTSYLRSHS